MTITAIDVLRSEVSKGDNKKEEIKKFTHVTHEKANVSKISIPTAMSWADAANWCLKKAKEEEQVVRVHYIIKCHELDGAYALNKVIKEAYGWSDLMSIKSFWFGDQPPNLVPVQISATETVQVPFCRFQLPNIEGWLQAGGEHSEHNPSDTYFVLFGEIKKKNSEQFHLLAKAVEEYVSKNSIYRGQALDSRRSFLDLRGVDASSLTFDEMTVKKIEGSLFTLVEHTESCRSAGVPLKRGVLLEGPYGTGKTLTANVLAQKCVNNGWTFLYVHPDDKFEQVLGFALKYQPAVLFIEDVDFSMKDERDSRVNKILNTVDGIESKSMELLLVMTSNHVEKIEKAMLRPGRIDDVIHLGPPDAATAEKLIRRYAGSLLPQEEDISEVGRRCAGCVPAFIREIVEKSKLFAITRAVRETGTSDNVFLQVEDLLTSADIMARQLDLLNGERISRSPQQTLGEAIENMVDRATKSVLRRQVAEKFLLSPDPDTVPPK